MSQLKRALPGGTSGPGPAKKPATGGGGGGGGGPAAAPPSGSATLVFDLLLASGHLDALDLTVIARCSKDLRRAVDEAWGRIRAGDPTAVLRSVARRVNDPKLNEITHGSFVSVKEAAACVACGTVTRCRHPIEGSLLCAACSVKSETTARLSPLCRFCVINQGGAYPVFGIDKACDLRLLLRYATRKPQWADKEKNLIHGYKYAPALAPTAKAARPTAWDSVVQRPPADLYDGTPQALFLQREIICLCLEVYGGPKLLNERLRLLDFGLLDPANPDK